MGFSPDIKLELINSIRTYILEKSNLRISSENQNEMGVTQKSDNRTLTLNTLNIEEVLLRSDQEGDQFLQINLSQDRKILITKQLIGFKPINVPGLDMNRLPKVVTTTDLVSVIEAIEDLMTSDQQTALVEIDVLKKVFHSILLGAEKVGFNVSQERNWLSYSFNPYQRATA